MLLGSLLDPPKFCKTVAQEVEQGIYWTEGQWLNPWLLLLGYECVYDWGIESTTS